MSELILALGALNAATMLLAGVGWWRWKQECNNSQDLADLWAESCQMADSRLKGLDTLSLHLRQVEARHAANLELLGKTHEDELLLLKLKGEEAQRRHEEAQRQANEARRSQDRAYGAALEVVQHRSQLELEMLKARLDEAHEKARLLDLIREDAVWVRAGQVTGIDGRLKDVWKDTVTMNNPQANMRIILPAGEKWRVKDGE